MTAAEYLTASKGDYDPENCFISRPMLHMCEPCFPEGHELGMLAEGYSLLFHEGAYHILSGQGHKDDILVTFPEPPWPDPDPECLDEGVVAEVDRWFDAVEKFGKLLVMEPEEGHYLYDQCVAAGWGSDGGLPLLWQWLFNRAGVLVQAGTSIDVAGPALDVGAV